MSAVSEDNVPITLDRASNIRIFEKLATPHMVDTRKIEEVKQYNRISDLPVGRHNSNVSVSEDRDGSETHAAAAQHGSPAGGDLRDSIAAIIQDGLRRSHDSPPALARSPESNRASDVPRFQLGSPPDVAARRVEPPPLPQTNEQLDAMRELERIREHTARLNAPSLDDMRASFQQRQQQRQPYQQEPQQHQHGESYMTTFRNICRARKTMTYGETGARDGGGYKPHADPDYADKRELIMRLDELRLLGYNVPKFDPCMPLEDLQTELARRTVSHGTVSTVDTVIGWINTAANIIETVNSMAGPFLPMENYAKHVQDGTSTPRFRYAMYQLVLRWNGRSSSSPWRVILMVLLMPLVQGILIKVVQWLAKGRLSSSTIVSGVSSLFNLNKIDPNKGVPSGIPGISPGASAMPDEAPAPPRPTGPPLSSTIPNPFADRYPRASEVPPAVPAAPAPAAAPHMPVQHTGKRPRLQRPSEVMSETQSTASDIPSGIVLTPAQMRAGAATRI